MNPSTVLEKSTNPQSTVHAKNYRHTLAVDTDNCDILLTKLSGIAFGPGALFLNALPPRSPFAPRATWLIALGLNAGVDELLWNVELVLKFFSMAVKKG